MNRKHLLYVENISPSSSEEHLITYLEKSAPVQQVYFLREKQCTKRSIAAFVRVADEADLDLLLLRNQQNYRGKRLFMVRVDQTQFFQADHTVIVRNITAKISEENLYDHFEECGKIAFLQIRTDDFAYIGFEDKSSVRNAMNKNNLPLKGSNLKIQLLTRNIEITIVNLDTLQARMPDLYRKMILPIEPRQPGVTQQQPKPPQQQSKPPQQQPQSQPVRQQQQQQPQQSGNKQQYSQPAKQQQQQFGNQQNQSQPPKRQQQYQPQQQPNQRQQQPQQQTGNQRQQQPQQQQQQRGQPQQQTQPQQQPQPQRQQQQQPQRQQMSTIQLLKEKANTFAGKQQQPQQKPPQQAPVVQPAKPAPPVQEQPNKQVAVTPVPAPAPVPVATPAPVADSASEDADDVQIIEPMETTEILDDDSDSEIQIVDTSGVPPIPSAYKPQPSDIMRPVKASEIAMSVAEVKNDKNNRSVWINNIQPETRRLTLVMYMEQFGDVETCKIGSSSNCYFTRWAKVCFTSEEAAKRATEYFLHPFQGRYLFVLACNRCIDEVPGKVFVLDYLSKYLVYEDVAKSFKHVGDVFYLVRILDNTYKVRIFFLGNVDANAVIAVKSIGGRPVNVEPFVEDMHLKLSKNGVDQFKLEREVMDPKKEARMAKILEIYKEESLDRCEPVVNPDGKVEGNEVLISNVHKSTSNQQIHEFLQSIGTPTYIRRENEEFNEGYQRIYVGFRTLSMVLKATELPADMTLNDCKPFIFVAWTKPHMTERNTVRLFFASKEITVQDIYNGLIHFGKIRYVEKETPKKALVVFDGHDNGINNCKVYKGLFIGPVLCVGKEDFYRREDMSHHDDKIKKKHNWFNEECQELLDAAFRARRLMLRHYTPENIERFKQARHLKARAIRRLKQITPEDYDNINEYDTIEESVNLFQTLLDETRDKPTEKEPYVAPAKVVLKQPEESIVIDDEDDVVEVSNNSPTKNIQPMNQNKKQPNAKNQPNQKNPQNKQQQQQQRKGPPQQKQQQKQQQQQQHQQRSSRDRNRNPFADNRSPQRHHPYQQQQQQQQDQRRSMNPWEQQDNQEPFWNEQQQHQQQFLRQQGQFMPDDRFNRNNDGPFDRFEQGGRNMNQFDQMMLQQFGNFSMNQQNDNGFNCGPMDSDDPPLDRRWGHQQQQQQHFNRFSPPRQLSPFGRGFRDDDDLNFGRDSPGIPPNIPEDEIDEYIMRKQEAIKRRLEQLDKQLITSVESSRHRDFEPVQRRRKGTVFSDNGDVHYVPNPAAVARNRERRGVGSRGGRSRGRGAGHGRRDREENLMHRQRDPFADVDIVPIIRISEERSPSPKRNRDEAFDTAQFDAAWC